MKTKDTKPQKTKTVEHIWSVLCRSSSIDQDTNNATLVNILERLEVKIPKDNKSEKVFVSIDFELITLWKKNLEGKSMIADCEVDIVDPSGVILQKIRHPLEIKSEFRRLRSRIKMDKLQVTSDGDYLFKVWLKLPGESVYSVVATIPFEVRILS